MSDGVWLSAAINLVVAIYFIRFYPASVVRKFQGRRLPPLFALLQRAIPVFGYLILLATAVLIFNAFN